MQSTLPLEYAIPIIESGLDGDDLWYTMPLCDRNFQTEIEESKIKGEVPKEALTDIINGLEELHSLGLVHRDLNPRNILLHDGKWKLADFGLVSPPIDSTSELSTTLAGWGTATHMAPEQVSDFKHADKRADVYAFGCILHDLFTDGNRIPYGKQSCDGPLGMVVERCTETDRDRRFKDITSLRGALFTFLAEPFHLRPSVEANEWAGHLSAPADWDVNRLREFARFLARLDDVTDKWNVLVALDEDAIERFYGIDSGYADAVAIEYCDWVSSVGFNFDFCDVLVQRLLKVYEQGGLDAKAKAVMAIAELGTSHNRYYVMRQLVNVCGENMDFAIAKRIAFEIQAEDAYENFKGCARGIGLEFDNYHRLIANLL